MEKRILGLDPGLSILGFGAIECQIHSAKLQSSVKMLDFGVISTSANAQMGDRLITLYDDLHTLIEQLQPDLVAIEKFFFYRMANTILVAQARGVIMLVLAQSKVPVVEFAPAATKLAVAGHGKAKKYEVQEAVAFELGLSEIPRPDDAADALALALSAWYNL